MKMILIGTLIFSSFNTIPVKIMSSVPDCYWKNFKAVLETSCRLRNSVERPRKTESSLHATKCWRPCVFDVRSTLIVWSLGGGPSFKKMAVKFILGLGITVLRRLSMTAVYSTMKNVSSVSLCRRIKARPVNCRESPSSTFNWLCYTV